MPSLTKAHDELYRRAPDERFPSLQKLLKHCQRVKAQSQTRWQEPSGIRPCALEGRLKLDVNGEEFRLSDWSFSQLCRLADVQKDTVNRLSANTACLVLDETLPKGDKPWQIFTTEQTARAVHGVSYTRLYNADVLSMVVEWATNFQPPQEAAGGGTGLYCGEQDMFCFLIDPTGWIEIGDAAFAPGFFLWNSEVGRRTIGIQSFWFQAVCQNHIVWDVTDVSEFSRKHTSNVHDALEQIRQVVEQLIETRDRRRNEFGNLIKKAMQMRFDGEPDDVLRIIQDHGLNRALAKQALEAAQRKGALTLFSIVDALTCMSQLRFPNGGDRSEVDQKAGRLLALAA